MIDDVKEISSKLMEMEPQLKEPLTLFENETNPRRQYYIAHLLILRYPGFSLFVYPYAWRNKSTNWRHGGLDLSVIDTKSGLRENWWKDSVLKEVADAPIPSFVSQKESAIVNQEFKSLKERIPFKTDYFCKLAIQWFEEMPDDVLVPEIMYHCIQMSRYTYAPRSSYDVFELLHKHFKGNEYTKKSRYHYWHKENSETAGD